MRRRAVHAIVVLLLVATAACSDTHLLALDMFPVFSDDFESFEPGVRWAEGEVHGGWTTVFDGYGRVEVSEHEAGQGLLLAPAVAAAQDETHAALVTTTEDFGDVEVEARLTTVSQLRDGEPNPWECGWLVWSYTSNTSFYYLALKTNGWELGKADPAYPGAQRFLADGRETSFAVGQAVEVRVRQTGSELTVWADGELLATFIDTERPYLEGRVGLYTEDAAVLVDEVVVSLPSDETS